MNWEGAELCFYINGESHAIPLTDAQFAIIAKMLGLQYDNIGNKVSFYSDDTLLRFANMKGNPLKLKAAE